MHFKLIFKEAIRDFRSKLQLYLAFTLFLIVTLSIIIGMLTFFQTYDGFYNNVFNDRGFTPNTYLPTFKFLNKSATTYADDSANYAHDSANYSYATNHYLQDSDGEFQNFVYDELTGKNSDQYHWGANFSDKQRDAMEAYEASDTNLSLVNVIGINDGHTYISAIEKYFNDAGLVSNTNVKNDSSLSPNTLLKMSDSDQQAKVSNLLSNSLSSVTSNDEDNIKLLNYLALIKLDKEASNPTFAEWQKFPNHKYYNENILYKYFNEDKSVLEEEKKDKIKIGTGIDWDGEVPTNESFSTLGISLMPSEEWMDEGAGTLTPNQFQRKNTIDYWIDEKMPTNEIGADYLKNRLYTYITPSFYNSHDYSLGQTISLRVSNDIDLSILGKEGNLWYTKDNFQYIKVKIIGTAISRATYFRNINNGVMFLPVQVLNLLNPLSGFDRLSTKNIPSYYGKSQIASSWSVRYSPAGSDTYAAGRAIDKLLIKNFWPKNGDNETQYFKTIDGRDFKLEIYPYVFEQTVLLNVAMYRMGCFVISAAAALLTIAVFWFVVGETIKLQKDTLWFLKALGEGKMGLSLLTTLSIMVPFLVSAIISIFGSLVITYIMNSAVSYNYAFHISGWSFDVFSLVTLIVVSIVSFLIFLAINLINLSSGKLNLHSKEKIGLITLLYMKTKFLYKRYPTGVRIGISFIVQNIFKNLLTLVLLLLSFSVVLFAMQFSSSARASAHSFEKRNAPYKSLMMNKLNNNDAISANKNFFGTNLKINFQDQETLKEWNEVDSAVSTLFGQGYQDKVVNSKNDGEGEAYKEYKNPDIKSNESFNGQVIMSTTNILMFLYDPTNLIDFNTALYNKYLASSYMDGTLLNGKTNPKDIANEVFKTEYDTTNPKDKKPSWWDEFITKLKDGKDPAASVNTDALEWNPTKNPKIDLVKILVEQARNDSATRRFVTNLETQCWLAAVANGVPETDHDEFIKKFEEWYSTYKLFIGSHDESEECQYVNLAIDGAKASFASTLGSLRSAYQSVKDGLGSKNDIPISVYFNRTIIPKDLSSIFSTDLGYEGQQITGFGLDKNDGSTYARLVNPFGNIPEKSVSELNDDLASIDSYNILGKKSKLQVHYIDTYISGMMAHKFNLSKGDIIPLKAIKSPKPDMELVPMYVKIDNVIEESSVYNEVYFNKKDYQNYINLSNKNNWEEDIENQKEKNNADAIKNSNVPVIYDLSSNDGATITGSTVNILDNTDIKNNLDITVNDNQKISEDNIQSASISNNKITISLLKDRLDKGDRVSLTYNYNGHKVNSAFTYKPSEDDPYVGMFNKIGKTRQQIYMDQQLAIENNEHGPNAKYNLNNSVFSTEEIPYSLEHLTLGAKTGSGYSLFDYVSLPILNYSSDQYPVNYSDSVYIFRLVTASLMNTVQPMITTMNRLVAVLLVVTFVVAVILIELVLLHNRQTILLFKAMGYKKRELNWYLLSGYMIADLLGLAAGVLISYFVIKYASALTMTAFHISLYPVWSWEFILTAILMAVVFIVMIVGAVTWYTNKQKPRDAFNTL